MKIGSFIKNTAALGLVSLVIGCSSNNLAEDLIGGTPYTFAPKDTITTINLGRNYDDSKTLILDTTKYDGEIPTLTPDTSYSKMPTAKPDD